MRVLMIINGQLMGINVLKTSKAKLCEHHRKNIIKSFNS